MGRSAQSTIKLLNASGTTIGFAMRGVLHEGRCYFAALNKAERERLNGRAQVAHRCLWMRPEHARTPARRNSLSASRSKI
jgi:hypothetical protein